jgi:hypothetical protein
MTPVIMVISFSESMQLTSAGRDRVHGIADFCAEALWWN